MDRYKLKREQRLREVLALDRYRWDRGVEQWGDAKDKGEWVGHTLAQYYKTPKREMLEYPPRFCHGKVFVERAFPRDADRGPDFFLREQPPQAMKLCEQLLRAVWYWQDACRRVMPRCHALRWVQWPKLFLPLA